MKSALPGNWTSSIIEAIVLLSQANCGVIRIDADGILTLFEEVTVLRVIKRNDTNCSIQRSTHLRRPYMFTLYDRFIGLKEIGFREWRVPHLLQTKFFQSLAI